VSECINPYGDAGPAFEEDPFFFDDATSGEEDLFAHDSRHRKFRSTSVLEFSVQDAALAQQMSGTAPSISKAVVLSKNKEWMEESDEEFLQDQQQRRRRHQKQQQIGDDDKKQPRIKTKRTASPKDSTKRKPRKPVEKPNGRKQFPQNSPRFSTQNSPGGIGGSALVESILRIDRLTNKGGRRRSDGCLEEQKLDADPNVVKSRRSRRSSMGVLVGPQERTRTVRPAFTQEVNKEHEVIKDHKEDDQKYGSVDLGCEDLSASARARRNRRPTSDGLVDPLAKSRAGRDPLTYEINEDQKNESADLGFENLPAYTKARRSRPTSIGGRVVSQEKTRAIRPPLTHEMKEDQKDRSVDLGYEDLSGSIKARRNRRTSIGGRVGSQEKTKAVRHPLTHDVNEDQKDGSVDLGCEDLSGSIKARRSRRTSIGGRVGQHERTRVVRRPLVHEDQKDGSVDLGYEDLSSSARGQRNRHTFSGGRVSPQDGTRIVRRPLTHDVNEDQKDESVNLLGDDDLSGSIKTRRNRRTSIGGGVGPQERIRAVRHSLTHEVNEDQKDGSVDLGREDLSGSIKARRSRRTSIGGLVGPQERTRAVRRPLIHEDQKDESVDLGYEDLSSSARGRRNRRTISDGRVSPQEGTRILRRPLTHDVNENQMDESVDRVGYEDLSGSIKTRRNRRTSIGGRVGPQERIRAVRRPLTHEVNDDQKDDSVDLGYGDLSSSARARRNRHAISGGRVSPQEGTRIVRRPSTHGVNDDQKGESVDLGYEDLSASVRARRNRRTISGGRVGPQDRANAAQRPLTQDINDDQKDENMDIALSCNTLQDLPGSVKSPAPSRRSRWTSSGGRVGPQDRTKAIDRIMLKQQLMRANIATTDHEEDNSVSEDSVWQKRRKATMARNMM